MGDTDNVKQLDVAPGAESADAASLADAPRMLSEVPAPTSQATVQVVAPVGVTPLLGQGIDRISLSQDYRRADQSFAVAPVVSLTTSSSRPPAVSLPPPVAELASPSTLAMRHCSEVASISSKDEGSQGGDSGLASHVRVVKRVRLSDEEPVVQTAPDFSSDEEDGHSSGTSFPSNTRGEWPHMFKFTPAAGTVCSLCHEEYVRICSLCRKCFNCFRKGDRECAPGAGEGRRQPDRQDYPRTVTR